MMSRFFKFLFLVFFVLSADIVLAQAPTYQGLALTSLVSKQMNLQIIQSVRIFSDHAEFVGVDDFGNPIFHIRFGSRGMQFYDGQSSYSVKKDHLKKIISLPISQQDFLSVLRFEPNHHFQIQKNKTK